MVRVIKVALIGFGTVGRSLAKLIALKGRSIEEKYNTRLSIIAIADSGGAAIKEEGFTSYELLRLTEFPRSAVSTYSPYGVPGAEVADIYRRIVPDIHVEATPSNYVDGEPGISNVLYALESGAHVVSCNKAPFVLKYSYIMNLASGKELRIKFKATVMAGTPLVDLLMSLKGYEVERVEGVLNGTTNFILTEMHENLITYEEALKKAQVMGIAESDPDLDVKGWDSAAKLVIISNVLGKSLSLGDVIRDGLSRLSIRDVYRAIKEDSVIKFVAELDLREGRASVKLSKVPKNSIFASITGTLNAVKIRTDVNEITLIGKGAGGPETAHAVLDDIITIAREVRRA